MRATQWTRLIGCGLGILALLAMHPAARADVFEDGQLHQFDGSCNNLTVRNSPSGQVTQVEMIAGADVLYNAGALDTSELTVSGGSIGENLYAYGSSQVAVSGGSIGRYLYAYDSSQMAVSGDSISVGLYAHDSSQVAVSGGSIGHLRAYGSSQVAVSGGSIGYLMARDSSQVTVSDGSIDGGLYACNSSQVTLSGGSIGRPLHGRTLCIERYANVVLDGSDFFIDGQPAGFGEYASDIFPTWYGTVSGTLASGETFSHDFEIRDDGKLILTPEPATLALVALGGVGALLHGRRQGKR